MSIKMNKPNCKINLDINTELAKIFSELLAYYKLENDRHRITAFENALNFINQHPKPIISGKEFSKMYKGVGPKTAAIIDEYIVSGTVQRLNRLRKHHPGIYALQFQLENNKIYGIGPATIMKLYQRDGVRNISDLYIPKIFDTLTHAQQLGLLHMDDINKRIPREEMDKINHIFSKILDDNYTWAMVGSYRREEATSGDIDILIKAKDEINPHILVRMLEDEGLLVGNLAIGKHKYNGLFRLSDKYPVRRIDILIVDSESYPYALLYFTGSQRFNILTRIRALELGMTLNEFGLYNLKNPTIRYLARTEKDICNLLKIVYVCPRDRVKNINNLSYL